jgi:hypothetical protein
MLVLALDALMADTAARPPLHTAAAASVGIRPAGCLASSLSVYIYRVTYSLEMTSDTWRGEPTTSYRSTG